MHADTLDWLAFRLLALGCEFEVHEPAELTAHLRALSARLTRAAGHALPARQSRDAPTGES
ncbi:WYL domain-containing protein [Nonomuraea longispora]|uniref:WYL domain-containing protein n=1 Tax=Nonomuraea longispora TaxID=1848320 RepID=UPI001C702149|nr:WYL domain-containing protein [Nonomuraea longispora]